MRFLFTSSEETLAGVPSRFLMMRPVGAGPLAASRAASSRFLVCRFEGADVLWMGNHIPNYTSGQRSFAVLFTINLVFP